jgi:predicted amidohydrolase YtcJ
MAPDHVTRHVRFSVIAALLAATVLILSSTALLSQPPAADLVVLNAKIVTLDPQSRIAQAAAVRNGVFVAVGSAEDVKPHLGTRTRVVDAGGRTIVPGLIDTHVHALGVAATEARQPFQDWNSVPALQAWIRVQTARRPAGTWIWTPRGYPTRVQERRFPTRAELDAAAPDHPVVVDGAYALTLNSAALKAANITSTTPNPPGGEIVKDAQGNPTGLLRNTRGFLSRFRPGEDDDVPLDTLERVHRRYNEVGITSVIERGANLQGYQAYRQLRERSRLHVRATITLRVVSDGTPEDTERFIRSLPVRFGEGDDRLRMGPLKVVADGGILIGTSYMREPYGAKAAGLYGVDDPSYRGFLTLPPEKLEAIIRTGHRLGWQMSAHVTGDAGVDAVLKAVEAADRDAPVAPKRFTLIHAYFANPETARRAAKLGVHIDTQPAWYYKDADAIVDALGTERLEPFIGLRTLLDGGATVAINTDHMYGLDPDHAMNPYNPFLTMYVAVTRKTEGGQVIGPAQRIPVEQALRMMTIDAARLSFDEKRKGSIEVGKLGDLVMLSHDLLTVPPDRIREIKALLTVIGGEIVFDRAQQRS